MKKKLRLLITIMVMGAMVLGLAACGKEDKKTGKGSEDGVEKLRVAVMTGDVTAWTAAVGKEKGIYEKHGIDLDVTEYAMGINTLDAVTLGQADIGFVADFACANRLGNTDENTDIRVFSRLAQVKDYRLYAYGDSVKTLSDLKGKKIGLIKGTIYEYLNSVALQSAGLTTDDVDIQAYESNQEGLALMESGKLDAMWSGGMASPKLEAMDGVEELCTQTDLDAVSGWVYVANQKFLDENKELVKKYLEATQEVYDVMNEDLEGAGEIIEKELSMPKEDFLALIANYELGIDFEQSAIDSLDKVNKWALENGYYDKEYDVRDYLNADAVGELYPDLTADELK